MNIFGHSKVRNELGQIARGETLPQSFLLFGPKRIGKQLVAREFALALVGAERDEAQHPDIFWIEPTSEEKADRTRVAKISIESVREAGNFLSRFPLIGKRRVLIVNEAEQLTIAAENALLKLLEEPNSTSVIILLTHRPGKLLPTVLSRVVSLGMQPLSRDEMYQAFPELSSIPDFFFSLGLPGLLVEAKEDTERFALKKQYLKELFQLSRLSWKERVVLAETLSKDDALSIDLLETWLIGLHQQGKVKEKISRAHFLFLESALETAEGLLQKNGNPRLLWEKLFTVL